jgi:thiol:disulfide interchange protein DsbD
MHPTKPFSNLFPILLLFLFLVLQPGLAASEAVPVRTAVQAYTLSEKDREQTGLDWSHVIAVTLDMEPEWYTYAHVPGGMGKPTTLSGATADTVELQPLYPAGKVKPDAYDPEVMVNTYDSGTRLFAGVPASSAQPFPAVMQLELLLCHPTKCVPYRRNLAHADPGTGPLPSAREQPWWPAFAALAVTDQSEDAALGGQPVPHADTDDNAASIVEWSFTPVYLQPGLEVAGLLSAILMGLLAGLILNIMPCVLPVVSLKLSALLN